MLVLFELVVAAAVQIVLLIALYIAHRAGKLKRVKAGYIVCTVTLLTLALIVGQNAWMQYNLDNFPLRQHGTVWETSDGSIRLSVGSQGEQDMETLYEGEYRAARLDSYGQPWPNVVIMLDSCPNTPIVNTGTWHMAGSGKMVIRSDGERIVLERVDGA